MIPDRVRIADKRRIELLPERLRDLELLRNPHPSRDHIPLSGVRDLHLARLAHVAGKLRTAGRPPNARPPEALERSAMRARHVIIVLIRPRELRLYA